MKNKENGFGYNERLFNGGIRGYMHSARYNWIKDTLIRLKCPAESILELGCFDGKLIDYLPSEPKYYYGYDANWENGLEIAAVKFAKHPNYIFNNAIKPSDIKLDNKIHVDLLVCMETLEHIPIDMVDGYLSKLSEYGSGYFLITVPNEMGILFLIKYLAKLITGSAEKYSFMEIINATLYRMHLVKRREHKGFDYNSLIKEIKMHFDVVEVSGFPFSFLPKSLCFSIGIIAKCKARSKALE